MADPTVSIPSLRAFLGQIALSKTTSKSPNLSLYSLQGGLVQGDLDVRDVVNALVTALDAIGGGGGSGFVAGGDLSGTATSQTVSKIQGVAISATPSVGAVLNATANNAAAWTTTPTLGGLSFLSTGAVTISQAAKAAAAASQAGNDLTWTGQNAVAGTSTAGAAAGGGFKWVAGNAQRLTSGNANGGGFTFQVGNGVGTGVEGVINFENFDASIFAQIAPWGSFLWGAAVNTPTYWQAGQTSDTACSDTVFQSQAPYSLATGANRNSGGFQFQISASASGGTAGKFSVQIAGTETARFDSTGLVLPNTSEIQVGDGTNGLSHGHVFQFTTNSDGTAKVCVTITPTANCATGLSMRLVLKRIGAAGSYLCDFDGFVETAADGTITKVRDIAAVATADVNGSTTPTVTWTIAAGAAGTITLTITVPNTQQWRGTLDMGRARAAG